MVEEGRCMDKGLEEGPWDGGEEEEATREGVEATAAAVAALEL